jgi:acetoacetyl-CoA synthetase
MTAFSRYVSKLTNKNIENYDQLYNWSISETEEFWKSIWINSGMIHSKPYQEVLSGNDMLNAKWFEGAEINFAENLLRYKDNNLAIVSIRENSSTLRITYHELYNYVSSIAQGFKELGVEKGDRVAGFVANTPEAVIGMLATASLGAIWSSCSPDFGFKGVLDRFGQIKPKILLAAENYSYNSKIIDCKSKIKQIEENIPEIEHIITTSFDFNFKSDNIIDNSFNKISNYLCFNNLLSIKSNNIEYERLPFAHPIYIMYSSGTTGVPKCIVHGAGGTLLQHYKELSLHTNLTRHDKIFYFTTCGWMMWNWLISSLMIGATVVLFDGSPIYPNTDFLWEKIEDEKISVFGTSPKFLSICQKSNITPGKSNNLESLKTILSTGSPLSEENFNWVYENVKDDVQLSSISGGTDIISCFMLGNPNLPVYPGEIQCRGLGMKVEAFDEKGNSVIDKKGELVCTKPFPSMPVYFWNDPDKEKYRSAYFDEYPGIWKHGDFIKITKNGGVVMYGRSDSTLNPGGVRIGTAEIYRIVESINEITDSIVIGQNANNDVKVILFVVLKEGTLLNTQLVNKIKLDIKEELSPRHVPSKVIQIKEVPRTISGKKVEIAVSKIINDEKVENTDALANPNSLKQFEKIRESL